MDEAVNPFDLRGGAGAIRRAVAGGPDLRVLAALCATLKMKSVYNKLYREEKKKYDEAEDKNKYLDTHRNIYVNRTIGGIMGFNKKRSEHNVIDEDVRRQKSTTDQNNKAQVERDKKINAMGERFRDNIDDGIRKLDEYMTRETHIQKLRQRIHDYLCAQYKDKDLGPFKVEVENYIAKLPIRKQLPKPPETCNDIQEGEIIGPSWYSHKFGYDGKNTITGTEVEKTNLEYHKFERMWEVNMRTYTAKYTQAAVAIMAADDLEKYFEVAKENVADVFMGKVCEDYVKKTIAFSKKYILKGEAMSHQACYTCKKSGQTVYHFYGANTTIFLCRTCIGTTARAGIKEAYGGAPTTCATCRGIQISR
jgi:hypothetical protein